MTTFESSVTIYAVTAIVFILVIGIVTIVNKLKEIIDRQYANWEQLRKIETHENVSTSAIIELKDVVDKMHRNLCVEIADKIVGSGFQNGFLPCYAPNGICTNPQMDCIGCPKHRSSGGTWATNTSIKAEDAPLQEWFNDNKED